ncbi:IS91 family transposase [Desulfobacter hydrogenophilus]|uniref:IS91 family transposase n=3 Tax=Desulfobacter hydrogenophilus TaxID=2291 RepID=A0ABX5RJF9_9BACT|nr:IS91 family transposase [Desulfobacter hydrogenophilus]QBH12320.1 IS91 family transposase [Desulfobacter hydrogenophilus]QBH14566.1 IS91 family transposase [Desulfobacter hydrogenophilus]QBH14581.1 IS91 family transposase [Desulfobacter hydrogenophilus]QBH14683.1 IS91 family transposase [Desulfobacter hydrogenophilus]QBH14964.1 IS91 family transposase [Desulfobacter hydrogenophilus]
MIGECCNKSSRPEHDIADIFRHAGQRFLETFGASHEQIKVMNKIITCRTAALGGHIDACPDCDFQKNSYNSCRNRHCPKCQTMTKEKWLDKRVSELLPATYYHLVFTLPHNLNPIILCNMKPLLDLLFSSVNQTIKQFATDPQWRLQGQAGFIAVLHTWNQTILDHFHLHCLVPGGVLSEDKTQWTPSKTNFLFKTASIVKAFKGIYIKGLKQLYQDGDLKFPGNTAKYGTRSGFNRLIKIIRKKKWSGYAKAPCSGPEKVLEYLGRYTHRVAISNYRIKSFEDGKVVFTWKDRAQNDAIKEMTLDAVEFIRRFLLHVLPRGFKKIRHFGFLSPRYKAVNIKLIRKLTGDKFKEPAHPENESVEEMMHRLTGIDIKACPKCGKGRLTRLYELLPVYIGYIVPNKKVAAWDTS